MRARVYMCVHDEEGVTPSCFDSLNMDSFLSEHLEASPPDMLIAECLKYSKINIKPFANKLIVYDNFCAAFVCLS